MNNSLTTNQIKTLTDHLKYELLNIHVDNISVINSKEVIMTFSKLKDKKLLISLNHQFPFASLVKTNESFPTTIGQFNDILRKEIKFSKITNIEQLNNDRVIKFTLVKTNELFEKVTSYLILELIPHRSNLIILNESDEVVFATHYTDLLNTHPVVKGMVYTALTNNLLIDTNVLNISKYEDECQNYLLIAKQNKKDEANKPLQKSIKSKISSLKNKIKLLNSEIDSAKRSNEYKENGDMILALSNDIEQLTNYIKTNNISYDKNLTPGKNAEKYFKKYKKAKRTLEIATQVILKAENDISTLSQLLNTIPYLNDCDVHEIYQEWFPGKIKNQKSTNTKSSISYITVDNVKILYGKNAKQNNEITFKIANKNDHFFHTKDKHGSHVVICCEKPTNEMILTACEICLILSGLTCGDIQTTQIKNIKKGDSLGMAYLNTHKLITLKEIRKQTYNLLLTR